MKLHRHPNSPPSPVETVEALATHLADGKLSLVFSASGDIGRVRVPPVEKPARVDGLWRHTCFEAFVRPPEGEGYFELNLAPSGQWAAYRFEGYRQGMMSADVSQPTIRAEAGDRHFGLVAGIDLAALPELAPWQGWRLALSAVIEADDGSLSHWALNHPPGGPDFHHPDCFVLELPPAV